MKFLYLMLLCAFPLWAQQAGLPIQGGTALQENQIIPYTHGPLFYMPTTETQTADSHDPLYEQKMRLFGTTDILAESQTIVPETDDKKAAYNNPVFTTTNNFGRPMQSEAVAQSLDTHVIMTPLSNGAIVIEENQKVIITNPTLFPVFKRVFAKTTPNEVLQGMTLHINGKTCVFNITKTPQTFVLTADYGFQPGIYQITLKYILQNVWHTQRAQQRAKITLLDNWPFAVNQMRVLILTPFAEPDLKATFLWGKNNVMIDDMVQGQTDSSGNLAYQVQTLIPAKTPVAILLTSHQPFPKQGNLAWFIWGGIVMTGAYFLLSGWMLKRQPSAPSVQMIKTISPVFVALFLHKNMRAFRENLQTLAQKVPLYRPLEQQFLFLNHPLRQTLFYITQIIPLFAQQIIFGAVLWGTSCILGLYYAVAGIGTIIIGTLLLLGMMILSYRLWGRTYLRLLLLAIPHTILAQFRHTYNWTVIKAFYLKTLPLGILFHIDDQMNTFLTQRQPK